MVLHEQLAHLGALTEHLQEYLQLRQMVVACEKVDSVAVCEAAVASVVDQARRVRIHLLLQTPSAMIWGNVTALRRVLDNLLANALAVTPLGGEVVLMVDAPPTQPRMLRFAVGDSGPGIAPEQHQAVFAPFVRLQAGGKGLGLGLAIVQELVSAMHGTCGVDSAPGQGCTFWVCLPAAPSIPKDQDANDSRDR